MRRIAASSLLFLIAAGLALPMLLAQESSVPACCRRNGKHHCAELPQGDGLRTVPANCPHSRFTALTSHSTPLGTTANVSIVTLNNGNPVTLESPVVTLHASGNTQKRGPPLS